MSDLQAYPDSGRMLRCLNVPLVAEKRTSSKAGLFFKHTNVFRIACAGGGIAFDHALIFGIGNGTAADNCHQTGLVRTAMRPNAASNITGCFAFVYPRGVLPRARRPQNALEGSQTCRDCTRRIGGQHVRCYSQDIRLAPSRSIHLHYRGNHGCLFDGVPS